MSRRTQDDPRYLRARHRLIEVLREFAAQRPAELLTVSEIAARAGVSRTTFYAHAQTPADLLAAHLIDRLSDSLAGLDTLLEDDPEHYLLRWRQAYIGVLEQVRADADIYRHVFLGEEGALVRARISAYFEEVVARYVEDFVRHLDQPVSELWVTMAISQQVHNTLVVITSWMRTGMVDAPELVMNTFISLAPPWQLARISASGRTSLGRSRVLEALSKTAGPPSDAERAHSTSSRAESGSSPPSDAQRARGRPGTARA